MSEEYRSRHAAEPEPEPETDTAPTEHPDGMLAEHPHGAIPEDPRVAIVVPHRRVLPTALVAVGVLLLELAFIASYVGGLHALNPKRVPVAVVAPAAQVTQLREALSAASDVVTLKTEPSVAAAEAAVTNRHADAVYVPASARLEVASGRGPALAQVLTPVFAQVAKATGGQLTTRDLAPLPSGDPRGLVTFYLVIGWIVGGYLAATVLGLVGGMTPDGAVSATLRLLVLALYSAVSGIAGAAIVGSGYGYTVGHFWPLAGVGALLVFAVGAATVGVSAVFGLVGVAIAILGFVIAGNPSAGGAWPLELVESPWRQVGPYLPNAAGVTSVRQVLFFGGHAINQPLLVLVIYAAAGIVLTYVMAPRRRPLVDIIGR